MKKRNLITNILYVVILVCLAGFLCAEFMLSDNEKLQTIVAALTLAAAVISVALVDIVFPVLDNKDMLKNKKYLILTIIKSVFFAAAAVMLFLYTPFKVITDTKVALIGFIVLYFVQYFISLDPQVAREEDDEEETEAADNAQINDIPVIDNVDNIDDIVENDDITDDSIEESEFTIDFDADDDNK